MSESELQEKLKDNPFPFPDDTLISDELFDKVSKLDPLDAIMEIAGSDLSLIRTLGDK